MPHRFELLEPLLAILFRVFLGKTFGLQLPQLFRAGADIRRVMDFHSLRHTFCTNLQCAGVSQREAMELMRHSDPRLTASTYTDASLLSLKTAVEKLTVSPYQIVYQKMCATGQTVTQPDAEKQVDKSSEPIENKGEKSLCGAASRILSKIEKWCALQVSNLRFVTPPHECWKYRVS